MGYHALFSNTTGSLNTAVGGNALFSNTTGVDNTALGFSALSNNTTGSSNTAAGSQALVSNTTGSWNIAIGLFSLFNNTTGYQNTATGTGSLLSNTTGRFNTATGYDALGFNRTGEFNTATGEGALLSNTTGNSNTANGLAALKNNQLGSHNTAMGARALVHNKGSNNIALGFDAGRNLDLGDNNIDIGNVGVRGEAATIRIGTEGNQTKTYIAGVSGVTVAGGVGVVIDANGHLGTLTSSARYKEAIQPMDKASEVILALKPVTFRCKHELDPADIPQFGLVAEQVEKVNPDLVARDDEGKPYSVRYQAVNAMLLNEFLKARRQIDAQQKQIEALTTGLQKVSAQLETRRRPRQTLVSNP
jgi:hypothetical protein